jgi:hypothetical protein
MKTIIKLVIVLMLFSINSYATCLTYDVVENVDIDGVVQDAFVCSDGEVNIIKPFTLDREKQILSNMDVLKIFWKMPDKLKENINNIYLLDYKCPGREEASAMYSSNNIYIYETTRSDSYIDAWLFLFVQNTQNLSKQELNKIAVLRELQYIIPHEAAHAFDTLYDVRNSLEWKDAVEKDGVPWVTEYAKRTQKRYEDFAESVARYINYPDLFKRECPNRYELIKSLLAP